MEIIKKYESGKVKLTNNGGVIFVKPFTDGDQNWKSSWLVADHQNDLQESDARKAFETATGIKEFTIYKEDSSFVVRVK